MTQDIRWNQRFSNYLKALQTLADAVALYGPALTPQRCATIADAMDELLLPYTIDLSVFPDLDSADLRSHIERVGLVLYPKSDDPFVPTLK